MIKLRVLFMVVSISAVFASIAMGAEKDHKSKKHAKKENVTILDLSGPSAPESEFPTVTDKGKL